MKVKVDKASQKDFSVYFDGKKFMKYPKFEIMPRKKEDKKKSKLLEKLFKFQFSKLYE